MYLAQYFTVTTSRHFSLTLPSGRPPTHTLSVLFLHSSTSQLNVRLHRSPRLINAVDSTKLNSTVERYCLHSSKKVNEAVDFKMTANELVREGVVVICDYLMKECQHILEKRNNRKKRPSTRSTLGKRS